MKKLVIKTAIITFISVILGAVLIFTALSLVSPKTMSDFTYSLGLEDLSCTFAVKAYEKSQDINDLDTVIVKALSTEDYDVLKKYSKVMIDRDEFSLQKKAYKNTILTYYVLSLVETGDEDAFAKTVQVYAEFYTTYDSGNPISTLLNFTTEYDDEFLAFSDDLTATQILTSDINKVNDR
jgi:hypothetical protein